MRSTQPLTDEAAEHVIVGNYANLCGSDSDVLQPGVLSDLHKHFNYFFNKSL